MLVSDQHRWNLLLLHYVFQRVCLLKTHTNKKKSHFWCLAMQAILVLFAKAISAETPNTVEMNGIPCAAPSNEKLCTK